MAKTKIVDNYHGSPTLPVPWIKKKASGTPPYSQTRWLEVGVTSAMQETYGETDSSNAAGLILFANERLKEHEEHNGSVHDDLLFSIHGALPANVVRVVQETNQVRPRPRQRDGPDA